MAMCNQIMTILAMLVFVKSQCAADEFPRGGASVGGTSGILQSGAQSGRFFTESPAEDSHARLVRPAAGSGAAGAPGFPVGRASYSGRRASSSPVTAPRVAGPLDVDVPRPVSGEKIQDRILPSPAMPGVSSGRIFRSAGDPLDLQLAPHPQNRSVGEWFAVDEVVTIRSQDPFIPVPLPQSQPGSERSEIDAVITVRYENPVTVRAIRAMSGTQAVQLFAEVSAKIDERSLEQPSYDVRVRRALRNLTIALENQAFVHGLGLTTESFRLDAFRNALSRLAAAGQIRDYQEAYRVLTAVIRHAQNIPGLTPGVVGFEFANSSTDTLDLFSGLELADPGLSRGTGRQGNQNDLLKEQIVGIGIEVREHAQGLIVVRPLRGGPAAEAGVESGDIILSIDGRITQGMKLAESVDLMSGPDGSEVRLRVDRDGRGEREFMLTRRTVRVWTVNDIRLLDGTSVGYFSLTRFSQGSPGEVDDALDSLHRRGMKSLIMDLRGNPGGLLTTCVEISDRFVPCGTIVVTKGRLRSDNMLQEATYSRTWNVPLVVLIDHDSASASEILAAAIQENQRGLVVGSRSYGKGSVQTHFPLSSIEGDLRLTTALFYSPSGRKMSGSGVMPDVAVDDQDGVLNGDAVLAEARRVAQSQTLRELAKAAGTCQPRNPPAVRSSFLDDIVDPIHPGTRVF